ncbi:MAG: STAS domain-containing protein [Cyanobacteriota bacterium]|nr:STAS domain-containing protein [Cyanobacteriota bacterium]
MTSPQVQRLNLTEVDDYLIVNFPSVLSDQLLQSHCDQISHLVEQSRHRGVILNLAAVSLLDYGALQQIRRICQSNSLLGSTTVLTGANASIAAYLASMPEGFEDLIFCQDIATAKSACG